MSSGGFLKRWSRRKHGAEAAEPDPVPDPAPAAEPAPASATPQPEAEEPIDPATLPPIESLGAASDYTIFLRKGVPEALRLAALRKAWMSDTFIRDFQSPAIEYGWDFTTPDFSLRATDDVGKLLDGIFGAKPAAAETPAPPESAASPAPEPPAVSATVAPTLPEIAPAARLTPNEAVPEPIPVSIEPAPSVAVARRKHGGALPS